MLGRKLAARLASDGHLADAPVAELILVDVIESERPAAEALQVEGSCRRSLRAGHCRGSRLSPPGRDFPPRRDCLWGGGERLRARVPRKRRWDTPPTRRRSRGRSELPTADHLRVVHRSLRITIPPGDQRRPHPDAADELRSSESDRRAAAERLHAPRIPRRHRHPPADDLRTARKTQSRCLGLLLEHYP